jgi:xanthine/CO dehydrogenase XdhC/CoxF family maturation factor
LLAGAGGTTPERVTTEWKRLLDFAASGARGPFALATLVARQGSSYRLPGARLLIDSEGGHVGCLSGGCLEEGIAQVGLRVLRTGAGERLHLDTRPHFGCPGQLDIFVEPLGDNLLPAVSRAIAARERPWLATRFLAGSDGRPLGTRCCETRPPVATEGEWCEELALLPRLLVVSGTSDADPLCELAGWLGWETRRVVHSAEAQRDLVTSASGRVEVIEPEKLSRVLPADERTACVIMTHHLGRDLAYLRAALTGGYPYVGLLGSRRRRETLLGELGEEGLLEDASVAERLRAPVGLDLGADEPRTIALAIVAEIQAAWAGAGGAPLRERLGPLHARPLATNAPAG